MTAPAPFSCKYSPNLPELLGALNCTIAISTYQAGKVVFLSAKNDQELVQLPRTFQTAMGIALDGDKMAIAAKDEVVVLKNSKDLAAHYPNQPNTYDGLFMPRATYYTGQVDIHDLHFGKDGLWAVNTSFSCLCLINEDYSFDPRWTPSFISKLASEDRCHLNGMAMVDGRPKYVSALGKSDTVQGWRENITGGGVIIDVDSNEVVAEGLAMPHSPRVINGKLYVLLSAVGKLVTVDVNTGKTEDVVEIPGFIRGMEFHGDHLFIGLSKVRKNSSSFRELEIADKATYSGVIVIHLPTGAKVAELKYETSVDEIYDVRVLPGLRRPGILNTQKDIYKLGLDTPNATFWAKKESVK